MLFLKVTLEAEDIRNEKVKVLRSMKPVPLSDVVVGQYRGRQAGSRRLPGYLDDKTVPQGRWGLASEEKHDVDQAGPHLS